MMRWILVSLFFLLSTTIVGERAVQDAAKAAPEGAEWLKQLEGEWTIESQSSDIPGQPAMKSTGTDKTRMLGSNWSISEIAGSMGETKFEAVMTLGFDAEKKKFVGTWVDSMQTHLWHYVGTLDKTGRILTLDCEGPSFEDPKKTSKYRDTIEIKSKDHRTLSSSVETPDKGYTTFMTSNIRRKK